MIKKGVNLIFLAFLTNCVFSNASVVDYTFLTRDKNSPQQKSEYEIIAVGSMKKTDYLIEEKGKDIASVSLNPSCSSLGLAGWIIPIPFIPIWTNSHDYSISISPLGRSSNKSKEVEFLNRLEVSISVDNKTYLGVMNINDPEYKYTSAKPFVFPINCRKIKNASILIKGTKSTDVEIEIEQEKKFIYRWVIAG